MMRVPTASVYIWGDHDLTGHASLEFPGWYVSFHPDSDSKIDRAAIFAGKAVPHKKGVDYAWDEGQFGSYSSKVQVDNLDHSAMSDYFNYRFKKDFPHYSLWSHNCSAVVAKGLFEGAGSSLDPHHTLHGAWNEVRAKLGRSGGQHSVFETVREHIEDALTVMSRRRLKNPLAQSIAFALAGVDLATRAVTWTPGAVKILAQNLAKER